MAAEEVARLSASLDWGSASNAQGSMLQWTAPHSEPFRELLVHDRVAPALNTILGQGYRLDAGPNLAQETKAEFHGGAVERSCTPSRPCPRCILLRPSCHGRLKWNRLCWLCPGRHGGNSEGYFFRGGRIFSGMLVVEFVLRDEGPDDGGLVRYQRRRRSILSSPSWPLQS